MSIVALRPGDRTQVTEGVECYRSGGHEHQCPYVDGSSAALAWTYGYRAAEIAHIADYERDAVLQAKAVQEGRLARQVGIAREGCPYTDADGDIEGAWLHGWDAETEEIVSSGNQG